MAVKGAMIQTGEHPLRELVGVIWGINILRTAAAIKAAPASVGEAYRMLKKLGPFRCGCCGRESKKIGGLAVLRVHPPADEPTVSMIPVALCGTCLQEEPVDNNLGPRILKTLTGTAPKQFKDWKDMLH